MSWRETLRIVKKNAYPSYLCVALMVPLFLMNRARLYDTVFYLVLYVSVWACLGWQLLGVYRLEKKRRAERA